MNEDELKQFIGQCIDEKMSSMTNMAVPNHYHNGWDANQIDPAVGLLGFPVNQVTTGATGANGVTGAAGSPLFTALNGTFVFQVDPSPKYVLWAYLNYNPGGTTPGPTGKWVGVQLSL